MLCPVILNCITKNLIKLEEEMYTMDTMDTMECIAICFLRLNYYLFSIKGSRKTMEEYNELNQ